MTNTPHLRALGGEAAPSTADLLRRATARLDAIEREAAALHADLAAIDRALREAADRPAIAPDLLSLEQAAELLGVGVTSVRELLAAHRLDDRRIGRRRLITRASVEALIRGAA